MASETGLTVPADVSPSLPEIESVPEVVTTLPEVEKETIEVDPEDKDDTSREIGGDKNQSEVEFVKKPGEFTTEVFKIEIRNLPRYSGYKVRADQ